MQLVGLCLAAYGILLLPLDVANRTSAAQEGLLTDVTLPMDFLWETVLMAIIIMLLGVIPFAIFYYEESGEG